MGGRLLEVDHGQEPLHRQDETGRWLELSWIVWTTRRGADVSALRDRAHRPR